MKGLILKDILNLKNQQGKTFLVLIVFYLLLALWTQNSSFFACLFIILGATLSTSSIAYDEKVNWNKYALTMPVTRKDIVTEKYLLSLIFIILGNILNLPVVYIIEKNISTEYVFTIAILVAVAFMYSGIMLPVVFKFGVENSRTIMVLIVAIPCLIIFLLQKVNIDFMSILEEHYKEIGIAIVIVAIATYIFSYLLSIFIMEHKEIS